MSESRIPTICPECGHNVKFWRDDKGHMVTVDCQDYAALTADLDAARREIVRLEQLLKLEESKVKALICDLGPPIKVERKIPAGIVISARFTAPQAELVNALAERRGQIMSHAVRDIVLAAATADQPASEPRQGAGEPG